MSSWVFFSVAAGTLVLIMVFGVLRTRGLTALQYTADPKAHPWWAIALSLLGTIVGGGMFIAVGQIGYNAGVGGFIIGAAYCLGLVILAFLSPVLKQAMDKNSVRTIIDLLEVAYSKRVSVLFASLSLCVYIFLLAAQALAVITFTKYATGLVATTWMLWVLVGLSANAAITYPIVGGLRKDITTDIVQMLIIMVAGALLCVAVIDAGVLGRMWVELPKTHLTGMGEPGKNYGGLVIGSAVFVPMLFLVRMDMWQRIGASKTKAGLTWALALAGVGSAAFYVLFTLVGIWARLEGSASSERATLDAIEGHIKNPAALGIIVGGLYAAVLSSADTFINNSSIFAARLLKPKQWASEVTRSQEASGTLLRTTRVTAVCALLVGTTLAVVAGDIVDLLAGAFALLLVFVGPVVCTLFDVRRSESAAFWSVLASSGLFVILFFSWDAKIAAPIAVVLALVIFLVGTLAIVSRADGKPPTASKSGGAPTDD